MVSVDVSVCPKCGGALKYYGMVPRIVRTKNRTTSKFGSKTSSRTNSSGYYGANSKLKGEMQNGRNQEFLGDFDAQR